MPGQTNTSTATNSATSAINSTQSTIQKDVISSTNAMHTGKTQPKTSIEQPRGKFYGRSNNEAIAQPGQLPGVAVKTKTITKNMTLETLFKTTPEETMNMTPETLFKTTPEETMNMTPETLFRMTPETLSKKNSVDTKNMTPVTLFKMTPVETKNMTPETMKMTPEDMALKEDVNATVESLVSIVSNENPHSPIVTGDRKIPDDILKLINGKSPDEVVNIINGQLAELKAIETLREVEEECLDDLTTDIIAKIMKNSIV